MYVLLVGFLSGCGAEPEPSLMGNWQIISMEINGEKVPPEKIGNTYMSFRPDSTIVSYALGDSVIDRFSLKGDRIFSSGKYGNGTMRILDLQLETAMFQGDQDGIPVVTKARRLSRIPGTSVGNGSYNGE